MHRATAAEVLGKPAAELTRDERDRAKAVNFGIIYGISSFGLSEQLGIERDEAQRYIDTYLGRYPRVSEFIERTIADGKGERLCRDAVRPPPADPGAPAPRTARCACWASGWPSTPASRAPPPTSSRSP